MRGRDASAPVIIGGAIALWVVAALLLGDLDPVSERGEWLARRRFRSAGDGDFTRPWCLTCKVVEEHVTTNRYVSGLMGVVQLIVFGFVVSGLLALGRTGLGGGGGRRAREIDEERIRRSVERSARRRDRRHGD